MTLKNSNIPRMFGKIFFLKFILEYQKKILFHFLPNPYQTCFVLSKLNNYKFIKTSEFLNKCYCSFYDVFKVCIGLHVTLFG